MSGLVLNHWSKMLEQVRACLNLWNFVFNHNNASSILTVRSWTVDLIRKLKVHLKFVLYMFKFELLIHVFFLKNFMYYCMFWSLEKYDLRRSFVYVCLYITFETLWINLINYMIILLITFFCDLWNYSSLFSIFWFL